MEILDPNTAAAVLPLGVCGREVYLPSLAPETSARTKRSKLQRVRVQHDAVMDFSTVRTI